VAGSGFKPEQVENAGSQFASMHVWHAALLVIVEAVQVVLQVFKVHVVALPMHMAHGAVYEGPTITGMPPSAVKFCCMQYAAHNPTSFEGQGLPKNPPQLYPGWEYSDFELQYCVQLCRSFGYKSYPVF
jgi:hypothetical protein